MRDPVEIQLRALIKSLDEIRKTLVMTNHLLYELVRPKPEEKDEDA